MNFFFFNDTATTEIYTLSLHDALPISAISNGIVVSPNSATIQRMGRMKRGPPLPVQYMAFGNGVARTMGGMDSARMSRPARSEEHTSELQSQSNLVCRPLLEKKNDTGR